GKSLTRTEPQGRTTKFTYAGNNVDLLTIQQQTSATPTYATLASFTYNAKHEPLRMTDAAGKVWTYAYNTTGQLTKVTDPLNRNITYTYDTRSRLKTIVNANLATA